METQRRGNGIEEIIPSFGAKPQTGKIALRVSGKQGNTVEIHLTFP